MMQPEVILLAMAFGALVALVISWPFWIWRMDRQHQRTLEWVDEMFDKGQRDEDD